MSRTVRNRLTGFARQLRREMPGPERLVWSRLRAHRMAGLAFRRQVPMLGYIADFVCHEAKLVIELDGGQHTFDDHRRRDERRDREIEARGYQVLRFFNPEVTSSLDDVIETIYRTAMERLPDHPDHGERASNDPSLPSPASRERVSAVPAARPDDIDRDPT